MIRTPPEASSGVSTVSAGPVLVGESSSMGSVAEPSTWVMEDEACSEGKVTELSVYVSLRIFSWCTLQDSLPSMVRLDIAAKIGAFSVILMAREGRLVEDQDRPASLVTDGITVAAVLCNGCWIARARFELRSAVVETRRRWKGPGVFVALPLERRATEKS